jgi:hypothetical protein
VIRAGQIDDEQLKLLVRSNPRGLGKGSKTAWGQQHARPRPQPADRENGGAIGLECSCSVIHLSASYSAIKPLMASVSPSGQRISTSQPVPGFFRATKVGRCSDILRICACGGSVQASYPATIKLTHYPGLVLCPLGRALGQSEARDRSPAARSNPAVTQRTLQTIDWNPYPLRIPPARERLLLIVSAAGQPPSLKLIGKSEVAIGYWTGDAFRVMSGFCDRGWCPSIGSGRLPIGRDLRHVCPKGSTLFTTEDSSLT